MRKTATLLVCLIALGSHMSAQAASPVPPTETYVMNVFAGSAWTPISSPVPAGCPGRRYCGDNGQATSAAIQNPSGISVDSAGNVYFADTSNDAIRRVDTSGVITTVLSRLPDSMINAARQTLYGNTTQSLGYQESLRSPWDVFVSSDGNTLWVADTGNNRILRGDFSNSQWDWSCAVGVCFTKGTSNAGTNVDGAAATSELLNNPASVAADSQGSLYISDTQTGANHLLFVSGGIVTILPVSGFINPRGIAVIGNQDVLVVDSGNYTIRRVTHNGSTWSDHVVGGGGTTTPSSSSSSPIAALSLRLSGSNGPPHDVAYDPVSQRIFVTDTAMDLVIECTPGTSDWNNCYPFAGSGSAGKGGSGNALCQGLNIPAGLAVHPSGYATGGVFTSVPGFNSTIVRTLAGAVDGCNIGENQPPPPDTCSIDPLTVSGASGQSFNITVQSSLLTGFVCMADPNLTITAPELTRGMGIVTITCPDAPNAVDAIVDAGVSNDSSCQSGVVSCPTIQVTCTPPPDTTQPPPDNPGGGTTDGPPSTDGPTNNPPLLCNGNEKDDKFWCPALSQWISLQSGARLPLVDNQKVIDPGFFRQSLQMMHYLKDPTSNNTAIGEGIVQQLQSGSSIPTPPLIVVNLPASLSTTSDSTGEGTTIQGTSSTSDAGGTGGAEVQSIGDETSFDDYLMSNFDPQPTGILTNKPGLTTPLIPALTIANGQQAVITVNGAAEAMGGGCSLIR